MCLIININSCDMIRIYLISTCLLKFTSVTSLFIWNIGCVRCKWCDNVITVEDLEDWVYSQMEDNTHILHGVVHSNGYGHLLTLNGREGGSSILSGCDIMSFWDRLCVALAVRFAHEL